MVKYALILLAAAAVLLAADSAYARGHRRGCHGGNCYAGGCPGGNCYAGVPVAPVATKTAAVVTEPAAVAATPAPASATPVVTTQTAPRYYTSSRRLFRRWAN